MERKQSLSRIAYLIIAHHQPSHLARLIKQLEHSDDHFFIHVDRKQSIELFQNEVMTTENIHWISDRKSIFWVGIGTVLAEVELLRAAYQYGAFDQYILLSGSDYPIKPPEYIRSFLVQEKRIFIPVQGCIYPTTDRRFSDRFNHYHFINNDFLNPRGKHSNQFFFHQVRKYLNKHPLRRRIPENIQLYQGPTWVGLTHAFVKYLFTEVAIQKLIRFYKFMYCPDEMFLPTLVKTSPYANDLYFDYEKNTDGLNWLGLFYTDWHTPNVILPKTLVEEDFTALKESHIHALFGRKFDEVKSKELLLLVDKHLLK
ncbi:beta-1,6-N-acetylglucosaminyltransferase [Siphonobacter sp. SORGH_AS_0500]|uniref:beta-1,6-N-acetylglucosaminyltransferase n=1 Tax=Siphonobacter sp. SORGH_AS_0500 TaxID=1864824 RepID=UPI00285A6A63|nr:beta-1,6-N-acetylglucosaminyltransferase [Siphonobacter sp. SORGH_AS_0500]MDR6195219.1 hypothetical protein [Siphonobacter sp. SORGH_AS_0500]